MQYTVYYMFTNGKINCVLHIFKFTEYLIKGISHLSWRLFLADMSSPAEGLLFFLGGMALEQQARELNRGENERINL